MNTLNQKCSEALSKWKSIPNYEGLYEISNKGEIKSLIRSNGSGNRVKERILKSSIKSGYNTHTLSKNHKIHTFLTHRLVAKAFIDNPHEYPQVNHKNGNKLDNNSENLEWCTREQNAKHASRNNLTACGEKNSGAKLKDEDVLNIRHMYPKTPVKDIAVLYRMSEAQIFKIVKKYSWKHI